MQPTTKPKTKQQKSSRFVGLWVDPATKRRATAIAQLRGVTLSELVRDALTASIAEQIERIDGGQRDRVAA